MYQRKKMAAIMAAALMIAGMAGCGSGQAEEKVTAQSLLEAVEANTKDLKSMEVNAVMDMVMGGEALSTIGGSLPIHMDMEMQTTTDPIASHVTGKVSALIMNTDLETYTVVEGEEILTYINTDGEWMLQRLPYSEEAVESVEVSSDAFLQNLDSITLEEETRDVDGTEAYILTGTIEGEDIMSLIGEAGDMIGSIAGGEELDYSGLSVDLEYAISADEKMPLYTNMVFHGLESVMDVEGITIDSMTMDMDYVGFDTVGTITVPEEAISSAQEIPAE